MTGTVDRSFDLQHTGKYILQIQDQSLLKTGTYHVGLERISAPFSPDAKNLPPATTASDKLTTPLEKDQFKVKLKGGVTYTFRINASSFVPAFTLYNSRGQSVLGVKQGSQIVRYTVPQGQGGTYVLQIWDASLVKQGVSYTVRFRQV